MDEKEGILESQTHQGMKVSKITPALRTRLNLADGSGLVVIRVSENSPAEDAGFRTGDILLLMDQVEIGGIKELNKKFQESTGGDSVLFSVKRGGEELFIMLDMP